VLHQGGVIVSAQSATQRTSAAATSKEPNLFELSNDGLQIIFSTSSFDGEPQFSYHDAAGSKLFRGQQIIHDKTHVGELVSVVLQNAPDLGSTTFSLLVPHVNLRSSDSANIKTIGITTLHRTTIAGPPHGQTDSYAVHMLHGTASFVMF
jgi:hypothetical protein